MNTDKHRFYTTNFAALRLCGILLFCFVLLIVPVIAQSQPKMSSRILLIPLDDRPPCLQFPVRMGAIGDAEIVTPPRELLGRFTEFGKSDEIIEWIKTQNLKSFDAAIVSVDMLAYGGLVAMRVHQTDDAAAMRRLELVREMRKLAPKMKIYGSSVIMRIAPTGDVKNEAYREKLSRWAEISVETDAKLKSETAKLESEIPAFALADYKAARIRDLKINLKTIDYVRDGTIDYLILSQDDAKPKGIHVADRERLINETAKLKLTEKIAVQPGADEVSMLLLARALTDKYNYHPKIKAVYSSDATKNKVMPYEDRALNQTVSFHIKAVGGVETQTEKDADILFYVYASRFEPNRAESFAQEIHENFYATRDNVSIPKGKAKGVIIADIDPKGDVQGGDAKFTEALKSKLIFQDIFGYAAWNTAGNTIGTALPHGLIFGLSANEYKKSFSRRNSGSKQALDKKFDRIGSAQTWFMLNRLLDDYVYHSLVRPEAQAFARNKKWNVFRFNAEETKAIEDFSSPKVRSQVAPTLNSFVRVPFSNLICENVEDFNFTLPWGRTFEAEIDYKLVCSNPYKQPVKGAYKIKGKYEN